MESMSRSIFDQRILLTFIICKNSNNSNIGSTWKEQDLTTLKLTPNAFEFANGINIDSQCQ